MSPKVSVIVPAYNVEEYLRHALDSILVQTMQDFEVICVDDCSTDASRDILKEYADKDSRISCIFHGKNMSVSQGRKDGVLRSSGKYVMFLDPDDYFEPNAFEVACKAIEEKGTDLVQFGTIVENCGDLSRQAIAAQNKLLQCNEGIIHGNINILNGCFVDISERKFIWNVWNKIYKGELCRRAFAAIEDGSFPFMQDNYSAFLIFYYADSIAIIKDKLYCHCFGRGVTGHIKLDKKNFTRKCKGLLILGALRRFVAKLPALEQKELTQSIEFIKRSAVNGTIGAFNQILPNKVLHIEDLQELCSSLDPADVAFVIISFREKMRELLPYPRISFALINIKNHGADANDVNIIEISDPTAEITEPEWICKNGRGHVLRARKGSLDLKLKCIGHGKLIITLRSMAFKTPEGNKLPIWIDYTKFIVEDKVIFDGIKPLWHDKPYRFTTEAEDGKIVNVHIEWVADFVSIGAGSDRRREVEDHAIKEANELNERLERELADIRLGISFRIGRAITYIPRKIFGKK